MKMRNGRLPRFGTLLLLLIGLCVVTSTVAGAPAAQSYECQVIVSPPDSIQAAIDAATSGTTICVRGGVYHQTIKVEKQKVGLKLVAYPGELPILDGQKLLPGGFESTSNVGLIEIAGPNTLVDGFEVRFSSARGVDVNGNNVTVRNLSVHDNWDTGINVRGVITNIITGVLVENSQVYNNLRKVRHAPVIYRGQRTGSGPQDWAFDPNETWDNPFWSGKDADMPDLALNGITLTFNDDGQTSRIYAGSARNDRGNSAGHISPAFSATGQQIDYSGRDLLFYEPATGKWTHFFKGEALGLGGTVHETTIIDAFQIEGNIPPESLPCPTCLPIIMSFRATVTLNIDGVATTIGPSDLVRFSPTAVDEFNMITAGAFTLERTAAEMGLPEGANIDALDRALDGAQLMSFANNIDLGIPPPADEPNGVTGDEDLVRHDGPGAWSLYFDGSKIPYNPFFTDLTAVWLDRDGHIYVSGDPVGGSALTILFADQSTARGNAIYNNYGEGLVAGRWTTNITLEDNVAYDNDHANIYLNDTVNVLVQRNIVFCTDNREFWRKGNATDYRPGLGLTVRDEDFSPEMPPPSSGQVIINNIVAGCNTNLSIGSQRPAADPGGLINGLIANNTFVNSRADTPSAVDNVFFGRDAVYTNSSFVNNLIVQTVPGRLTFIQNAPDFSTFTIANNAYSSAPAANWFPGESGRIIGDPGFVNGIPPLPTEGSIPDPADYRLSYDSPAFDAGQSVNQVMADFFGGGRAFGLPDIGAHELAYASSIIVTQEATPGQTGQAFGYEAGFSPGSFNLGDGQQQNSGLLPPGVYSVAVGDVEGWATTATCDDGSSPDAIELGPTETVTCTFSSERQTRLIVNNVVEPSAGAPLFDFSLAPGDSFQLGHGSRMIAIAPDVAHSVAATPPAGWERTAATCNNGAPPDNVSVNAGEWVTCTFSHRQMGRIIVAKQTQPAGAAGAFAFNADFDPDGFTATAEQPHTSAHLSPGSYSVVEAAANGWWLASATCDDGSSPDAIDLGVGETVTCTFVNARLAMALSVTPTPERVNEPGGDVSFAVEVHNDGGAAMTLTGLSDSVYGDVAGAGNAALLATTCALPQTVAAGDAYTCAFTAFVGGAAGQTHRNTLTATADGPGNTPLSGTAEAVVAVNASPSGRIVVIKQTDPPNTPGTFNFTADYGSGSFSLSHGQSHDSGELPAGNYAVSEIVPAGWEQTAATCDDGDTPGAITLVAGQTIICTFTNRPTAPGADATVYVATNKKGKVRTLNYTAGDILAYDRGADTWSMVFDGSDVGLKTAINDFEFLPDGSLILTLKARTALNSGAARFTLEMQDIARFTPTSMGTTTTGSFARYFDGSDVGLTTAGEAIDALARLDDGTLLISTAGAASLPRSGGTLAAKDEDMLAFAATSLGETTTGEWSPYFRGADVPGLAAENLTAAWIDMSNGTLYIAVTSGFTIGGVKGNQQVVLAITPARVVTAYWNAKSAGFAGAVDGLAIGD